ncbi:hypothetical protein D915_002202 [Fasciola hepatica]|uniref:EGF-like domain-containing protein n=1 Tax=Fasciola hepatica TaxID=6192 RepID=A0A4E0RKD0_FASHE|nr:hypothetical protein D915_002202 [Fasciola hepatica]
MRIIELSFFWLALFFTFSRGEAQPKSSTKKELPKIDLDGAAKSFIKAVDKGGSLIKQYGKVFSAAAKDGPFYVPLWELKGYKLYAAIGLPPPTSNLSDALNPTFSVGQIMGILKDDGDKYEPHNVSKQFTLYELYDTILNLRADENLKFPGSEVDTKNLAELKTSRQRITYIEAVKPRFFFHLFVNLYRAFTSTHDACKGVQGGKCVTFPAEFSHTLWMYTWVICSYIGSSDTLDVDGICPRLCRPHSKETVDAMLPTSLKIPALFYASHFDENALDVCEQIQYAIPGSCRLTGNGTGFFDYKCDCAFGAYEWKITKNWRGCLLRDDIMNTESVSNTTNWHVLCSPDDWALYCDKKNTEACYYRLWKESNEPELNLTTFVRQSRTPFCHCKKGFAGISCGDKFDPCLHLIPLAINDPENYVNVHMPDGPYLPLYSTDEISGATGNWLCGVQTGRGTCKPDKGPESQWEAWSPCIPICGRMRYKYRIRMCVGDTGCVGSAVESFPCRNKTCALLSAFNQSGKSKEYSVDTSHYYNPSRAQMLSWMLGLVLPLELVLITLGVVILEKCILKSKK